MAIEELFGREFEYTPTAVSSGRQFNCDWDERKDVSPRIGDVHPEDERLYVQHVTHKLLGRPDAPGQAPSVKKCRIIAQYGTRNLYRPVRTTDISVEYLETTAYRRWLVAGTLSTMRISIPYPLISHTFEGVSFIDPRGIIWELGQCLNALPFEGFPRGSVLYMGGRVRDEYTNLDEMLWRTQHKFLIRPLDWNKQWREAKQDRDVLGRLRWSTSGEPIMAAVPAGVGGWDMLDPPLFTYANFNLLYMVR